jgi:hypothetical protein
MVRAGAAALMLLWMLLIAVTATAQQRQPAVVLTGERVFVVLPDSVLKDSRVRSRLASALTTTFILKTSLGGSARIEIRYDLWDEVFRVRRDGGAQQAVPKSHLEEWWRTPIDAGLAGDRRSLDAELTVLPFSADEESDARQWLSKSGGAGAPSADPSSIVDVLIGTTLSARPIVSFRWSLTIARKTPRK